MYICFLYFIDYIKSISLIGAAKLKQRLLNAFGLASNVQQFETRAVPCLSFAAEAIQPQVDHG